MSNLVALQKHLDAIDTRRRVFELAIAGFAGRVRQGRLHEPGRLGEGSHRDSAIDDAERKGLLKPGGTIIEEPRQYRNRPRAGGAARLQAGVHDHGQAIGKVDLLKALGAEVIVCLTTVDPDDPRSYYSVAKTGHDIPNSFYPNQYENPMNPDAQYGRPARALGGFRQITHFVCGMGTGGTISGVRYLKEKSRGKIMVSINRIALLRIRRRESRQAKTYVVEGIGEDIFSHHEFRWS